MDPNSCIAARAESYRSNSLNPDQLFRMFSTTAQHRFTRVLKRLLIASMYACASVAAIAPLSAQNITLQGAPTGRIQGTLFDSLTMKPVTRANVMIMSSGRTALSDDRGRFAFDTVQLGEHEIGFSSRALDSAGLGVLGGVATVTANQTAKVSLTTPSFRTFWTNRCNAGNTFGKDSTIVWGTVRDVVSDSLRAGVVASFSWFDLRPKTTGLIVDELRREVASDAAGNYFVCGLPGDVVLTVQAISPTAASGRVTFAISERRVHYLDFSVSSEMVVADTVKLLTREDSVKADLLRGTASVRGTVVDHKGKPLGNALVALASLDSTVRTAADGTFRLGNLPAGTHTLLVRRVGSAAATPVIQLRPNSTVETTVQLSDIPTLATVNVRTTAVKGRDRLAYEERQKAGFGYAIDGRRLASKMDMYQALYNIPGLTVVRSGFGVEMAMRITSMGSMAGAAGIPVETVTKPRSAQIIGAGQCLPEAFLDGIPTPPDLASSMPIDVYRAIEVYPRAMTAPGQYGRFGGCGIVLFWTKFSRW